MNLGWEVDLYFIADVALMSRQGDNDEKSVVIRRTQRNMNQVLEPSGFRSHWQPYAELLSYIRPYKGRFFLGVGMGVLFALVNG